MTKYELDALTKVCDKMGTKYMTLYSDVIHADGARSDCSWDISIDEPFYCFTSDYKYACSELVKRWSKDVE